MMYLFLVVYLVGFIVSFNILQHSKITDCVIADGFISLFWLPVLVCCIAFALVILAYVLFEFLLLLPFYCLQQLANVGKKLGEK